jgi:8-hydroxy-5-deazaflavin:NADPH oxidoreductase
MMAAAGGEGKPPGHDDVSASDQSTPMLPGIGQIQEKPIMRIGIIGSGFNGRAVARLAVQCGVEAMLSNSRDPNSIATTMMGYQVGTATEAMAFGDVILLTVPFSSYRALPPEAAAGKILIDAVNYDPRRDGRIEALEQRVTTSSAMIADHFAGAHVVKTFNVIVEKEIERDARQGGATDRRALPVAGDAESAKATVVTLLNRLGFDAIDAGPLAEGWRFDRGQPAFGVRLDLVGMTQALSLADAVPDQVAPVDGRPA